MHLIANIEPVALGFEPVKGGPHGLAGQEYSLGVSKGTES
jgi:hypothetical protein